MGKLLVSYGLGWAGLPGKAGLEFVWIWPGAGLGWHGCVRIWPGAGWKLVGLGWKLAWKLGADTFLITVV